MTAYGPIKIPGTDVRAYVNEASPGEWDYGLWTEPGDATLVAKGRVTLPLRVTPEQVARVAFILEVDYP